MPEIFGKENSEVAQDTSLHGKFVKTMIKQRGQGYNRSFFLDLVVVQLWCSGCLEYESNLI